MTAEKTLGRVKKKFPGRKTSWVDFFFWGLPGVLAPIGLMFFGAYQQYFAADFSSLRPESWYLFALIALIPFAILSRRRFISSSQLVVVHENGLRIKNIDKKHNRLLWCQIAGIRTDTKRFHLLGLTLKERNNLFLEPVHGYEIRLTENLTNLNELISRIKSSVYPLLLPSMKAELKQGQTINFGPLEVNPREILTRRKSITWDTLRQLEIRSGSLVLETSTSRPLKLSTSSIPNIELFLQLIHQEIIQN